MSTPLFVLFFFHLGSSQTPPIDTTNGKITGFQKTVALHRSDGQIVRKTLDVYLGVPYAQPPTRELRFKPPLRYHKQNGVFKATKHATPCPQPRDTVYPGFWGSEMWNHVYETNENCLQMNIWVPHGIKNASTLVWIFGGGFTAGSPSLAVYNGEGLASQGDVIVININYRLGLFGFWYMGHPDAPGNMGLLDQQLALVWIRENIHHFGGNPDQITIFGESAGAASVVAHMMSGKSRKLFKFGILQSGSLNNPWALDRPSYALEKSRKIAKDLDCPIDPSEPLLTIRCMEKKPVGEIVGATWNHVKYFMEFPYVLVSEDANFFIDENGKKFDAFEALLEGNFKKTNLIVGMVKDEGTFWINYGVTAFNGKNNTPEAGKISREQFFDITNKVLDRFPRIVQTGAKHIYLPDHCGEKEEKNLLFMNGINQMVGDSQFTCDAFQLAEIMIRSEKNKDSRQKQDHKDSRQKQDRKDSRQKQDKDSSENPQVFIYHFTHRPSSTPWPDWMGVIHGYEIELVVGIPLINRTHTMGSYSSQEAGLSEKIIGYWANFAKTGLPTFSREWRPASASLRHHMELSLAPRWNTGDLKRKECDFWNSVRNITRQKEKIDELTKMATTTKASLFFLLLATSICRFTNYRFV